MDYIHVYIIHMYGNHMSIYVCMSAAAIRSVYHDTQCLGRLGGSQGIVAIPDSGSVTQLTSQLLAMYCSAQQNSGTFSTHSLRTPMNEQQNTSQPSTFMSHAHDHLVCRYQPASMR